MRFTTNSGSRYEILDGKVRRINPNAEKRADGEWLPLLKAFVRLGRPAVLVTESLSEYGPDDYDTIDPGAVTTRTTTFVTQIEEDE